MVGAVRLGCRRPVKQQSLLAAALGIVVVCVGLLGGATRASAHAILESTAPAEGTILATGHPPTEVTLHFDENVEVGLGGIKVVNADGDRVDLGQIHHVGATGADVAVSVRTGLTEGTYLVLWRVVSADSHPVSGSFTFSYGRAGKVASAADVATPASTRWTSGVFRFLEYLAVLGLIGALVFATWCWPGIAGRRRFRRLMGVLAIGSLAACVVECCVQAAVDAGSGLSGAWNAQVVGALLATQYGQAHLVRAVVLAALAVVVITGRPRATRPEMRVLFAAILVVVAGTIALSGHSGVGAGLAWRMPLDVAHILAAGAWLGGLAALGLFLAGTPKAGVATPASRSRELVTAGSISDGGSRLAHEPAEPVPGSPVDPGNGAITLVIAVHRFSRLAAGCVVVLVLSGVVQALRQVGELDALFGTSYGHLLIAKVSVLAAMLALAAVSRAVLIRARRRARQVPRRLLASVAGESALGVAIVAITSALVTTIPARDAYRPAIEQTLRAGTVTVQLSAVPTGPREVDLHLYTFGRQGTLADVRALSVRADQPGQSGASAVDAHLAHVGIGHFTAPGWLLPNTGQWRVTLTVRTSQFDAYTAATTITIR